MRDAYIRVMDALYAICMAIAGFSIVIMALIIAWSVYTRYVLVQGSFWAEPISIMLLVQMTFYGAAACYRANAHISIDMLVRGLGEGPKRVAADRLVDSLMFLVAAAMLFYGVSLVYTTWFQVYPELQQIKVGAVYSAVPISGAITLAFIFERAFLGGMEPLEELY